MNSITKYLAIIFLTIYLAACAGTPFEWDQARQIKAGMTIKEVTKLIGTPTNVKSQDDGLRYVWTYVNSFSGIRTLVVDFKDGKVIKAPPIPDEFK